MGDSDGTWGDLASQNDELAGVWDDYERLPDPGDNEALDALCERKHISIPALVRIGAKLAEPTVLAFAYTGGIKYRDIVTGKRWSYTGSTWPVMKIVRHGATPSDTVIVVEGETDGARLTEGYTCDVALMPAGAKYFPQEYAAQLDKYAMVLVGLDDDTAGNEGAATIMERLGQSVRFMPPENDWCDTETLPPLPDVSEAPQPLQILVPAGTLVDLEPPDVISYFEQAVLPVAGFLMLHGWVKSFKSFIGLDILAALTQGQPWAQLEPTEEPVKTAVVQFEIPWPYYQQRVKLLRGNATDPEQFDENFFTWDPLRRPDLVAGNKKQEDYVIRELLGNGVQVALFDPVRRLAGGIDLNAHNEVGKVLNFFERCQDYGITIVATHHDNKTYAGKGDPLGMTGDGAFAGDPDTVVSISLPEGDDFRTSPRRNLNFILRNAPAIGGRGMQISEDGEITYTTVPFNDDEAEEPDAPAI